MNSKPKFIIRLFQENDFQKLMTLMSALWPKKHLVQKEHKAYFNQIKKMPDIFVFVSENENSLYGFCTLYIRQSIWANGPIGIIGECAVSWQNYRNTIQKQLFDAAIQMCKQKNCKMIELDGHLIRKIEDDFLIRFGFVKKEKGYSFIL